jgi:MOSC domain-containing protein YiiM
VTPRGKVIAVCISPEKGTRKKDIGRCELVPDFGLQDDAHGGPWHRQVSLLAMESIRKMIEKGLQVGPGDFAENICTEGLDLTQLPIGTQLRIGSASLLEVTQIGKVCHTRCAIFYQAGDCVMPREGIFARVLQGGEIKVGDPIDVLSGDSDPQR